MGGGKLGSIVHLHQLGGYRRLVDVRDRQSDARKLKLAPELGTWNKNLGRP